MCPTTVKIPFSGEQVIISEELKGKDIQQELDRKHTIKNVVIFLPWPVSVFVMGWGYQRDCSSSSKIKIHLYLCVCV